MDARRRSAEDRVGFRRGELNRGRFLTGRMTASIHKRSEMQYNPVSSAEQGDAGTM